MENEKWTEEGLVKPEHNVSQEELEQNKSGTAESRANWGAEAPEMVAKMKDNMIEFPGQHQEQKDLEVEEKKGGEKAA